MRTPTTTTTSTTTTTTTIPATTTTTIPIDPDNSACHDNPNDGAGGGAFDLDASIHRPDDHSAYVFTATAVGPWTGHVAEYTFNLGTDYVISGVLHADNSTEAIVSDLDSSTNHDIVDAVIVPGKVTLTVPNAQISRLAGTLLDWMVALTVDGASKDLCTDTGFGTTNPSP